MRAPRRSASPARARDETLTVTVRLFARVHSELFADLADVGRGSRGARAIYLMTRGLLHASGVVDGDRGTLPRPSPHPITPTREVAPASTWFVSAVLADTQEQSEA